MADSEQLVFCIPWGHNRTIIDKCRDNQAKTIFFVKETIENKRRLSDRAGTAFEHKKAPDFSEPLVYFIHDYRDHLF